MAAYWQSSSPGPAASNWRVVLETSVLDREREKSSLTDYAARPVPNWLRDARTCAVTQTGRRRHFANNMLGYRGACLSFFFLFCLVGRVVVIKNGLPVVGLDIFLKIKKISFSCQIRVITDKEWRSSVSAGIRTLWRPSAPAWPRIRSPCSCWPVWWRRP